MIVYPPAMWLFFGILGFLSQRHLYSQFSRNYVLAHALASSGVIFGPIDFKLGTSLPFLWTTKWCYSFSKFRLSFAFIGLWR